MSDPMEDQPEAEAPRRGRPPRAQAEQGERRRRVPGSLNRMVSSNLGIPDECLDTETWHYHWINDQMNQVGNLSTYDDYDPVTMEELEANAQRNRSEFKLNRDSLTSGIGQPRQHAGRPPGHPRRPDAQAPFVLRGRLRRDRRSAPRDDGTGGPAWRPGGDRQRRQGLDSEVAYVPRGNTLGDTGMRRRGPIPQRSLRS